MQVTSRESDELGSIYGVERTRKKEREEGRDFAGGKARENDEF